MKTFLSSKTAVALAVAAAATASYVSPASEQPMPPPLAGDASLPSNIPLGSPAGQVLKLAQAGVDASVIQSYISNCPVAFNLDADKIISLTDAGVTSDMLGVMFAHDKSLPMATPAPVAPPPIMPNEQPAPVAASEPPSPPSPPTDLYLEQAAQTLAPYGTWVQVDGYGSCWRPTVVVYDSTLRPYCAAACAMT